MSVFGYLRLVLARAWSATWEVVMRHDRGTFFRDVLLFCLTLFLLFTLQGWLVESRVMSEDNAKDTIVWAILGLVALVSAFSIVFVIQTLVFAPYSIWRDQQAAIYKMLPPHEKKRLQPYISESPRANELREELCNFANKRLVPASKALTSAQLSVGVQLRTFFGGGPFGEAIIGGIMAKATEAEPDFSDITYLDYLQRHKLSEIEAKLLKIMKRYESLQLMLYQSIERLIKLGGATNAEIDAKLAEWKSLDDAMYTDLETLKNKVGIPTVCQIEGRTTRTLCSSAYIPAS